MIDPKDFDVLDINLNRLDQEWINQPKLYFYWAAKVADAHRDVEKLKADLELERAYLDSAIRKDPDKFGCPEKITEKVIETHILLRKSYGDISNQLLEKRHELGVLSGFLTALDHRKKALEKTVDLRLANYFAEPRPSSEEAKKEMENVVRREAFQKNKPV